MKPVKFVTIVGARPQFIKASVISREIQFNPEEFNEVLVHTGQHFDDKMSANFFQELNHHREIFQYTLSQLHL